MRTWLLMLGGPIVWAVHFFALYIVASVFLTTTTARVLTVVISLLCFAANGLLFVRARRGDLPPGAETWMRSVALYGCALTGLAILWQTLPAFLA